MACQVALRWPQHQLCDLLFNRIFVARAVSSTRHVSCSHLVDVSSGVGMAAVQLSHQAPKYGAEQANKQMTDTTNDDGSSQKQAEKQPTQRRRDKRLGTIVAPPGVPRTWSIISSPLTYSSAFAVVSTTQRCPYQLPNPQTQATLPTLPVYGRCHQTLHQHVRTFREIKPTRYPSTPSPSPSTPPSLSDSNASSGFPPPTRSS